MPVYIQNCNSGLVLDVKGSGTDAQTEVIMWNKTGNPNQLWEYQDNMLVSKLNGYVLDVNVAEGTLSIYPPHGGENQKWYLEGEGVIKSGCGRVLDVHESNYTAGGKVGVFSLHGGDNQRFRLVDA